MGNRIDLIIIDPQNSFCYPGAEVMFKDFFKKGHDTPDARNAFEVTGMMDPGELFVPGANEDMDRVANMIDEVGDKFYTIHVTLDCHHYIDIAHPIVWTNSKGEHPAPFTIIEVADVDNEVWFCAFPQYRAYCKEYIHTLANNKRYPLCIWPPHCLIGTSGNGVYKPLAEALGRWEARNTANVDFLTKGSNWKTEHYSAVQADVPDPEDPTTGMNMDFIDPLRDADMLVLTGEALSHCLANTGRDIVTGFGDKSLASKFTLLQGASSNVPGFEFMGEEFVKDLSADGMIIDQHVDTYLR